MRNRLSTLLVGLVLGGGCAAWNPSSKPNAPAFDDAAVGAPPRQPQPTKQSKVESAKPSEFIVTPANSLTGKVVRYNDAGRFVVLDFPLGRTPQVEQRMFVYRRGLKVGEVKVSEWQRENLIVADLTAGEAQAGDEVKSK